MSTKLQSQGVHHVTLVGADRQASVDFRPGVLGMPLVFDRPRRRPPAHGAHNIAEEHLADAIELRSRQPAPDGKRLELEADFARV
jgi:catechol 2,3-dioxygenase-like lactoylglutathione lyase family enzyme